MICCKGARQKNINDKIISTWQKTHLLLKNNELSLNKADWLTLKFFMPEKWVDNIKKT